MKFIDRLSRAGGGWASPLPFLDMTEDEYRAWLRERGYSEHASENQLRELREARQRHDLPGPSESKREETADSGLFDRLARRRARGEDGTEKKR